MVTLDSNLGETTLSGGPLAAGGRWQHPKILLVLGLLAFGLSANALINGGAFSDRLQWKGVDLLEKTALLEDGAAATELGRAKACARMAQIVQSACGLSQRDHDTDGIQHCVAQELKYTMWSAYGCE
jgi:hypothetical protein